MAKPAFEEYEIKSERLGPIELLRRSPTLTFTRFGLDFARIEFEDTSLFRYQSPGANLIGRCGKVSNDQHSVDWYVSLYNAESEEKVAMALNARGGIVANSTAVVSIDHYQICNWNIGDEESTVSTQSGEVLGRRKFRHDDKSFFADVGVSAELPIPIKDYLLAILTLLYKPEPWFSLSFSSTIETDVEF